MEDYKFPTISIEEPLLPEMVAEHIIEYINTNHLTANDRLPNEIDMAKSFGVSRGTIRSAIALLKSRNIVVRRRGSGTYITENPGQIDDPFGLNFVQNQQQKICELTETRGVLEPGIAALAAVRATDEDIQEMERLQMIIEDCINRKIEHIDYDCELHIHFAKSTHNSLLVSLITETLKGSMPLLGLHSDLPVAETLPLAMSAHRRIISAIKEKDPEKARAAMVDHQKVAMGLIDDHFSSQSK